MKYSKHPIKSKYLYKSETNGSVYNIITKSTKFIKEKNNIDNRNNVFTKIKLFDDIVDKELWCNRLDVNEMVNESE